eukprot:SAG31_NODE_3616_length_4066_cov_1.641543_1_plen_106_part_00
MLSRTTVEYFAVCTSMYTENLRFRSVPVQVWHPVVVEYLGISFARTAVYGSSRAVYWAVLGMARVRRPGTYPPPSNDILWLYDKYIFWDTGATRVRPVPQNPLRN